MARVFVYGTLKKGQPNYRHMISPSNGLAKFQGRGRTAEKYPVVITGKYNIPYMLNLPGKGYQIDGDIYTVDDQMLQFLDEFEGCPETYQRTLMRIEVVEWEGKGGAGEDVVECFVYYKETYPPEWVSLPYHQGYDSQGKHGLRYVLPEHR
ncbi:GGACT glutamylaminecyclotransferase, partial [Urocolius indicus]|nr:GGACT glutamylaminecyclotransferase [Urocolius indicus]